MRAMRKHCGTPLVRVATLRSCTGPRLGAPVDSRHLEGGALRRGRRRRFFRTAALAVAHRQALLVGPEVEGQRLDYSVRLGTSAWWHPGELYAFRGLLALTSHLRCAQSKLLRPLDGVRKLQY